MSPECIIRPGLISDGMDLLLDPFNVTRVSSGELAPERYHYPTSISAKVISAGTFHPQACMTFEGRQMPNSQGGFVNLMRSHKIGTEARQYY